MCGTYSQILTSFSFQRLLLILPFLAFILFFKLSSPSNSNSVKSNNSVPLAFVLLDCMTICLFLSASLNQIPSVLTDKKLFCFIPNSSSKFSEDFIEIETSGFPIAVASIPIIIVIIIGNRSILIADLPELLVMINSLLLVSLKKQVKLASIIISGRVSKI